MHDEMSHSMSQLILTLVLLLACMTDLRFRKIPNWLTFSATAIGFLGNALVDGLPGMLFSLKGLALGLGLFLILYMMGAMGAGDVKLLAAVGSFIGADAVLSAGFVAMLLGGLYAIAMMISHYGVQASLKQIGTILKACILMPGSIGTLAPAKAEPQLRYALVIGLGTLMSQWMENPFFTF